MYYAAKPDRELSDTPWSKAETVRIARFVDAQERKVMTDGESPWIPVTEKLPELKRLQDEIEGNPGIAQMPWPIMVWASPKSKESRTLLDHIKAYQDNTLFAEGK